VVTAVLALAFLVPLTTGTYDLSVGAVMSLALVLISWFGQNTELSMALVVPFTIGVCALAGALSGFIVVKLRVNSLIATLGVSQVLAAIVLKVSNNRQITGAFDQGYLGLGRSEILGVPRVMIYLLVIAVVLWFILEQTQLGRHLFAVGGNPEAARLAGLKTERLVFGSLVASAVIAGLAGVIFSMKVGAFTSDAGPGFLFPALAAVFFGASQFQRRPNVWGTLVAFYALSFGIKGLQLVFGPGTFWISPLFEGTALILAVALASRDVVRRKLRPRRAAEEPAPEPRDRSASATR